MLRGILPVIRNNDLALAEQLRKMDDTVDELYSAIKFYLTQISREALSSARARRWTDIVSFTINMEQIGDIIERVLQDVEDKKIRKARSFSDAGMAEICHLHEALLANLRLGMSVFLDGHVRDAQKLLEEKARFRDLEHEYAANAHRAAAAQHRAEHRDELAAPRPDQRPEAHQLAHLLDRLPDPRVGRRADANAHPPFEAEPDHGFRRAQRVRTALSLVRAQASGWPSALMTPCAPRPTGGSLRSCPPARAAPVPPPLLRYVGHPPPLAVSRRWPATVERRGVSGSGRWGAVRSEVKEEVTAAGRRRGT